jgi:hypothetical protein
MNRLVFSPFALIASIVWRRQGKILSMSICPRVTFRDEPLGQMAQPVVVVAAQIHNILHPETQDYE